MWGKSRELIAGLGLVAALSGCPSSDDATTEKPYIPAAPASITVPVERSTASSNDTPSSSSYDPPGEVTYRTVVPTESEIRRDRQEVISLVRDFYHHYSTGNESGLNALLTGDAEGKAAEWISQAGRSCSEEEYQRQFGDMRFEIQSCRRLGGDRSGTLFVTLSYTLKGESFRQSFGFVRLEGTDGSHRYRIADM